MFYPFLHFPKSHVKQNDKATRHYRVNETLKNEEAIKTMEYIRTTWTFDDLLDLYKDLMTQSDESYRTFHEKISKTNKPIIGIRMPIMKKIAKQIAKGNVLSFLENVSDDYYEYILLKGLVIAFSKLSYENFLHEASRFLDEIDNWAICDSYCSCLSLNNYRNDFFKYLDNYLTSQNPWHIRAGLVIMLDHYLDKEHIKNVLERCDNIHHPHYYVKMAQAWLVSAAFVKYPKETLAYLKSCHLDMWTFNKAISKTRESYRVTTEDKAMLAAMKRK